MKIKILFVVFILFPFVLSCAAFNFKRGANKECNCFYSSQQPNVKITFADNYYFRKKYDEAHYFGFLWDDKDKYIWIFVNYFKNTSIKNTVDYYIPIEKVLYDMYGSRNMNIDYGTELYHGRKFYYCDYIKHESDDKIFIIRDMVLPSYGHDWVQVRFGHTFKHSNFKKSFSSGSDYLNKNPAMKKLFYTRVRSAIKSIEPFEDNNTFK